MSTACSAASVGRTIGPSDYSLSVAPACLDFHAATPFGALPCVTRTSTSSSSSMPSNIGLRQCFPAAPAPAMVNIGISPGAFSPRRSSPCQSPRSSSCPRVCSSAHATNMTSPSFLRNQTTTRTSSLQSPSKARAFSPGFQRSPRSSRSTMASSNSPANCQASSRPAKAKGKSSASSRFVSTLASPSFSPALRPEKAIEKNSASGQLVSSPRLVTSPSAPSSLQKSTSVNLPCCQAGSPPRSPRSPGWTSPVQLSPRLHHVSPCTAVVVEKGTASCQFATVPASLGFSPVPCALKKSASFNPPRREGSPRSPRYLEGPPRSPRSPGWTTPVQLSPRPCHGSHLPAKVIERNTTSPQFASLQSFSPVQKTEMIVANNITCAQLVSSPRVTPAVTDATKKSTTVGRVIYPDECSTVRRVIYPDECSRSETTSQTPLFGGHFEKCKIVTASCENGGHELPAESKLDTNGTRELLVVDQEKYAMKGEIAPSSSLENLITNQICKVLHDEVQSDRNISLRHPAFFGPPFTQSSYEAQHAQYDYLPNLTSVQDLCGLREVPVKRALSFFRDAAEDGRLTRERFMETYKLLLQDFYREPIPLQVTSRVKHAVFSLFDRDANGCVDMMELICGVSLLCKSSEMETMEAFFSLLDLNSDGYITIDEMIQFLMVVCDVAFGPNIMSEDLKERFAAQVVECFLEADADRDGKLSLADFTNWFEKPRDEVGLLFSPLRE